MKNRFRSIIISCLALSLALSGCRPVKTNDTVSGNNSNESEESDTIIAPKVSEDILSLCDSYIKKGDYSRQLTIMLPEPELPDHLSVYVEDSVSNFQFFSLKYEDQTNSWPLTMEGNGNFPIGNYSLEKNGDGSVLLVCDNKESPDSGSYFSMDMLTMPEAFKRPLNETDLLTLSEEQLALIRNEFFAVYGRKFTNESYQKYFLNCDWYAPLVDPDEFSDHVFSRLIKRNIEFLSAAEKSFDEAAYQDAYSTYTSLPETPYLSLLQDGEVSVHLDSASAKDMGLYYIASGSVAVPVTVTEEEYRSLEQGKNLELCVNELTGETITITRSDETEFAEYDEGNPYIIIGNGSYLDVVNFRYEPYENIFTLWVASDDTIFNTVYEGDIYVLKGASTEYFHNFEHYEYPLSEQPFVYQIMDFDEEPTDFGMNYYYGNYPVFDENGYLKALYFYGD